jgi:signal transduction histidine kinase
MLDKVFDKYESDGQAHGTGLGLTIVKTFVEAHGGTVTVQSQPGAGAVFHIMLPSAPKA